MKSKSKRIHLDNFIKDLAKDLTITAVTGPLGAMFAWFVSFEYWWAVPAPIFAVVIAFFYFKKYRRLFKLIKAGIAGYYFPVIERSTPQISEKKRSFGHTKSLSQFPKIECQAWVRENCFRNSTKSVNPFRV